MNLHTFLLLQNLCFILPQFLYQFFCGYSQQVSMTREALRFKEVLNMKVGGKPSNHTSDSLLRLLPPPFPTAPLPPALIDTFTGSDYVVLSQCNADMCQVL